MNRKITAPILVVAASTAFALMHCSSPLAGNGSGIGNGVVAAMLHNPGGSPAKNAKVVFYPVNYNPHTGGLGKTATAATPDSTTTDNNGNYTITLDTGTYNILANGDSGLAYQDSITTVKGDTVKPPPDTLKPAGTIQGIIQMQPGDDARTVFILFMGTHTFTMPVDIAGNFTTDNMAAGTYSVRIITTTPNYKVLDTNLSVIAGTVNVLPGPIVLQYTGIPIPQGLRINYDTLKQIVNLIWNKPINGRKVKGYNIYRRNVDSNTTIATINLHLVTDTVYSDSTGTQDQTYEYSVAVMDTNNTEGVKSTTVQIRLAIKDFRIDSIGTKGTGVGQLNRPQSAASNKSYYVIIDWQDPFPSAARANIFDLQGNYIRTFTVRQDTSSDNLIGIKCAIDSMNTIYAVARDTTYTFDISGNILAKYSVAVPEIIYSANNIVIETGSTPQIIASGQNIVLMRNLNGDTVSRFSIDGSYGGVGFVFNIDHNGDYLLGGGKGSSYFILKCGPTGNVLATWDSTVSEYMKFNGGIEGIVTDTAGRVFVDDMGNSKIKVFGNDGVFLGQCETFLNTQKWQGTDQNYAIDQAFFLNANNDVCLLERDIFSKLYIYHIPVK
ncbi:MAG: hypothetical protein ABSF80_07125 [Chitinispirillaceae bacterium]|jgi:hypothetical protein